MSIVCEIIEEPRHTVAAHGVATDSLPFEVLLLDHLASDRLQVHVPSLERTVTNDRQFSVGQDLGELESDVREHVVMFRPLGARRIQVEAGACAKIPIRILAFNAKSKMTGVD